MQSFQIKMQLTRPAKSKGGDRYEGKFEEDKIVLYFPQKISRAVDGKTPANQLMLKVEH